MRDDEALKQDYRSAGFNNRLGFGRAPALIMVDFVKAYLRPESPRYAGVENAREASIRLLSAAREARISVIHTNVVFTPGGADGGIFFRKVKALKLFERGAPGGYGEFGEGLLPRPDEIVISKQYASAFFGTPLAATLTAHGVDTLLIAGVSTSGCVRATAVDACQNGFIPIVVRDAVGDRHPDVHEASLFDIDAKYADVVGLAEVEAYLRSWSEIDRRETSAP
jgi:nicotinamidase-related amidase